MDDMTPETGMEDPGMMNGGVASSSPTPDPVAASSGMTPSVGNKVMR